MNRKIARQPQMGIHKHAMPQGPVMIFIIGKITVEGQLAVMSAKIHRHIHAFGMGLHAFHAGAGTARTDVITVVPSQVEAAQQVAELLMAEMIQGKLPQSAQLTAVRIQRIARNVQIQVKPNVRGLQYLMIA